MSDDGIEELTQNDNELTPFRKADVSDLFLLHDP